MASLNQATLIGFVGEDPKVVPTKNGKTMATFSLATTERGFTRQDGTAVEDRTDWHNIVFFGKPAEIVSKYVRKGASLFVQGKMRTRSYVSTQDNITRYVTEIIGESFQLLDRRSDVVQHKSESGEIITQKAPNDDDLPF